MRKVPTECPYCGFTQQEPAGLISTYCRGCGDHYTVARQAPVTLAPAKPAIPRLVKGRLLTRPARRVPCPDCGHEHIVPPSSASSSCPACGTPIDLHDHEFLGHSTHIIRTFGTVHVGRDGFLNSTSVTCGNAYIEGRIAGKVTCADTLRLKGSGICRAQITTRQLIVDRGATLRFPSTIHAAEIVIRGFVEADVECSGTLHIGRHGGLDGDVQARSMIVDKGGHYSGDVQVTASIQRPEPAARGKDEVRVLPGWQTGLAFG